ncbi:UPF0481 protein At3g47200-like [Solanum stenotomum]|uniref:UPF0481 protein At3g47200-like n=1 Tax=Solanum stenotomum TaxID=172797 RepID=UPI0020D0F6BD|nr:UPF0481 protein At3g47200-like [Solanum stenotomum]
MPLMQMVPMLMKEENKEDYEPKVVSFGPYHHGNEKLKFVEDFKPTAVQMFIGDDMNEAVFIAAILGEIENVKKCYLEEFTCRYTDIQFAHMMLRDACVILNYFGPKDIDKSYKAAETINNHLGSAVYSSIRRDMYLLENQIPFLILEMLVALKYNTPRHSFIKAMERDSFKMFFNDKNGMIEHAEDKDDLGKNPAHLLEIFRRVIVTGPEHEPILRENEYGCCNVKDMLTCLEEGCGKCCKDDENKEWHGGQYVFRSVTDLKSKGIYSKASGIKSLKGVRFSPTRFCRSAELKLPFMYVDIYTRVFFKNMIAYEFSPNPLIINDKSVTSYVSFMKLLVVTEKDVKEMRENKIIINCLGSDDDVVQVYKDLNTYEGGDTSFFWDVKEHIEHHYHSKIRTWMAEFRTTYFNNPWTIIALVASLFLLCLDIVQTYYAIHPPPNDPGDA